MKPFKALDPQSALEKLKLESFPQPRIIPLTHPVLLCHGYGALAGLIKPAPLQDPCMILRSHGIQAFAPNIIPYASIETRAAEWMKRVNDLKKEYGYRRFHVIAHSMGGLDMRYALHRLGAAESVASLTTIATPHQGTSLAGFVLGTPERMIGHLGQFFDWLGQRIYPDAKSDAVAAAEQLTIDYVRQEFNPQVPDHPDVRYASYSAAVGKGTNQPLSAIYLFQNHYIFDREGPNDAFVSVESSKWGEHVQTVPISHLEQMGISVGPSRKAVTRRFWSDLGMRLLDWEREAGQSSTDSRSRSNP
jgi:triacylglycerol lipase